MTFFAVKHSSEMWCYVVSSATFQRIFCAISFTIILQTKALQSFRHYKLLV